MKKQQPKQDWLVVTRSACGTVIDQWVVKQVQQDHIFEVASKDQRVSKSQVEEWTVIPQKA